MLTVSHLTLSHDGARVLSGLSFRVAEGSTTVVIGAGGAGKTTLIHAIAGLVRPERGSLRFQDRELIGLSRHQICDLGIGLVPQGRHLFPTMTVRENIEIGARPFRTRRTVPHGLDQGLDGVLARFPSLTERLEHEAASLPAFERQKVAIGRCLMGQPRLILFDEPTQGLPAPQAREMFRLLGTLAIEGLTLVLAEQNAAAALRLADDAHILEYGRLVHSGTGLDLLEDPRLQQAGLTP